MRTFTPMNTRVLLKGLTLAEVERIIVPRNRLIQAPEVARKIPQLFVVAAVGPLAQVVKVGDTVAMSEYLGTKLEFDGEEYIVAMETDILGVLREQAEEAADDGQGVLPLGDVGVDLHNPDDDEDNGLVADDDDDDDNKE